MRTSIFLLIIAIMFGSSCGDDDSDMQLITPATYTLSSISSTSVNAFRMIDGEFVDILISDAGDPDVSGVSESLDLFMLDNDSQLQFNDGFDLYNVDYKLEGDRIEFVGGGSQYSLQISDNGKQLKHSKISGGPYSIDSPYGWVSASCQDVDCEDINFDEWLFDVSEGDVYYVIVFEEFYERE